MRPTDMRNLRAALTVVAATALLAGCASSSGSGSSAAGASHQSSIPSGSPSDAHTSPPAPSTTPPSASALPAPTAAPSALPTVAGVWVPQGATSATLSYTGAAGAEPITKQKQVTGATFERLSGDLNQLTLMPAGRAQCNIVTGESTAITVSGSGRTLVFLVPGVACRGVRLTVNGAIQPLLIGSSTLIGEIRSIVGYAGMPHPLPGSVVSRS
ncbi:hypothetical protein acdb102_19370 [Acidothermaceae bacterium B102]|nr:hypothetical protein acdb102_19370 [Acidothermaceae bacterium B102]